jgi:DNA-binding transcriptional ArsR family regulator
VAAGAGGARGRSDGGGRLTAAADPGPVLAALADPTRRTLLDRLAALGAASATTLAKDLPVSRQAVVQHLTVLDAAGLTAAQRHGREVRHRVRPEALTETAAWMNRVARQWDARLATIAALAEGAERAGKGSRGDPPRTSGPSVR